jgi:hypothetical protein
LLRCRRKFEEIKYREQGGYMRRSRVGPIAGILIAGVFFLIFSSAALARSVTIEGQVNDNYQIITEEGIVYEVAETEKGDELVQLIGEKVRVTGKIEENQGVKTITVISFEVID